MVPRPMEQTHRVDRSDLDGVRLGHLLLVSREGIDRGKH